MSYYLCLDFLGRVVKTVKIFSWKQGVWFDCPPVYFHIIQYFKGFLLKITFQDFAIIARKFFNQACAFRVNLNTLLYILAPH